MIRVFFATVAGLCAIADSPSGPSVSASRQFVVYGSDLRFRGAVCDLAERTKRDLLQLTNQRDQWTAPIVIHLQNPQANLPEIPRTGLALAQTGFGLKVQLNLKITPDLTESKIRRELLRSILLEMMYRHAPGLAPGARYLAPPEWLLIGIEGKISNASGIIAQPMSPLGVGSIENFLRESPGPIDLPGRVFYQVGSVALIELLVHQRDGRQRLARLISDLPQNDSDEPTNVLRTHFPELLDQEGSLQKTWLANIEQLSRNQTAPLLSGEQTERMLDAILSFEISASKSSRTTYRLVGQKLDTLAVSANPLYRPIMAEYQKLVGQLARGKTTGVSQRMSRLRVSRKALIDRLHKMTDYLNWFEATHSRQPSGLFSGYMKAAEDNGVVREKRRDPISVYLDALETEFENASPRAGTAPRRR